MNHDPYVWDDAWNRMVPRRHLGDSCYDPDRFKEADTNKTPSNHNEEQTITMTNDEYQELAEHLIGTCQSVDVAMDQLGLTQPQDANEIEDRLLDFDCEQCKVCGWWSECCELSDPDNEETIGVCDQCR